MILFDGTFWSNDELIQLGMASAGAATRSPAHGRQRGEPRATAGPAGPARVYVHINNTNPVLLEGCAERRAVEAAGLVIGRTA